MLLESFTQFLDLMHEGGPLMWVLLVMSIVSVALMAERAWFWVRLNSASHLARVARMEQLIRRGDRAGARVLAEDDHGVYGSVVKALLEEDYSESLANALIESVRPRLDRSMGTLSTMITAAPLVGLLGTVLGLIFSFRLLHDQMASTNPASVGLGLSEALFNTAAGLVVTVITIFPYMAFRVQVDRTLGRLESILSTAAHLKVVQPAAKEEPVPAKR